MLIKVSTKRLTDQEPSTDEKLVYRVGEGFPMQAVPNHKHRRYSHNRGWGLNCVGNPSRPFSVKLTEHAYFHFAANCLK